MTSTTTPAASATTHHQPSPAAQGRGWVFAGIGAGIAGIAAILGSSFANAVYDPDLAGDAAGITEKMSEQIAPLLVFHVGAVTSGLLLVVFGAGLRRHLARRLPEGSLAPQVAAVGLVLVSVALLVGSALNTEFIFGLMDTALLVPETAVLYGHWVGTVPWVWAGSGLTALAVGQAGRSHQVVPRWLTWVSLVLGVLTTLLAISPLQYMAGMTGPLWLLIAALGLLRRA
ncbi:MAG TPA: hypothetical protein VLB29_06325 [Nocardioidaceae bacterium]|nr:hypothetical protein [Nocardioidaceae bacterium]